jgi:hypothetical protein
MESDQAAVGLDARSAILRHDLRAHTPRGTPVRFEKHPAGKAHYAQEVRKRVHDQRNGAGVWAKTSGVLAIPPRPDCVQSVARAGRIGHK